MENLRKLQNELMRVLVSIKINKDVQEHFMGIIGVMFGKEHPDYNLFMEMTKNERVQIEMLHSTETHKYHNHFMVLCHLLIKDYIKEVSLGIDDPEGPREKLPEKDILLADYLGEIEKASQHKPTLIGMNKYLFPELQRMEYSIFKRIFPSNTYSDPLVENEFTGGNYRQLLTVWAIYPQLIFSEDKVWKFIELCKTGKINV